MTEQQLGGPEGEAAVSPPAHLQTVEEARSCTGFKLDEIGGGSVGRVEAVLVDAESGEPAWLVVKVGLLGQRTAVPYEFTAAGVGHVWVAYGRDAIRGAPRIDPSGLDRAAEIELCEHYGLPAHARRRGLLEGRGDAALTSVPA